MAALMATVVVVALAGCSSSHSTTSKTTISLATISQRYQTAAQPADAALAAIVNRALAYSGGSTAGLDSAVPSTVSTVHSSAGALNTLAAQVPTPVPLHQAIGNVAHVLDTLVSDLTAMQGAQGGAVQPAIAKLVADAGREAAANSIVGPLITSLTTPTIPGSTVFVPAPALTAATTTTTPAPTTTTTTTNPFTVTTTTRPRVSTTTVPRTTTTPPPPVTTTTVAPTTTTMPKHTTTTFHLL
jgi:hypothetical protein